MTVDAYARVSYEAKRNQLFPQLTCFQIAVFAAHMLPDIKSPAAAAVKAAKQLA
jgi:hypothetical protein